MARKSYKKFIPLILLILGAFILIEVAEIIWVSFIVLRISNSLGQITASYMLIGWTLIIVKLVIAITTLAWGLKLYNK